MLGCARRNSRNATLAISCCPAIARGRREHPVGADKITALAQAITRKTHGIVMPASENLHNTYLHNSGHWVTSLSEP